MSGPLCDAVLERKESAVELASIEAANLFVVPLDRRRGWYRYHHLFRDLLRRELEDREPELVPLLNQRAADWFEEQGDAESTLDYSYAAGNADSAARILSSIAMPMSSSGRVTAVETWLDHFDDETQLRRYPAVALEGSRIHAFRGRAETAEEWLAAAERGTPKNGKGAATRACIDVLRGAMCADGPEGMLKKDRLGTRCASARPSLAALGAGRERDRPSPPWRRRPRRQRAGVGRRGLGPHRPGREPGSGTQRALPARRGARRRRSRDAGSGGPPPDRGARARRLPDQRPRSGRHGPRASAARALGRSAQAARRSPRGSRRA